MLCPQCFIDGRLNCISCEQTNILLAGDNAKVISSVLMIHLIEYLHQHSDQHVMLVKPANIDESYSIILRENQKHTDVCLQRIHIKYMNSAKELNQFILTASLCYSISLIVIDRWDAFYEDGLDLVQRNKTVAVLKSVKLPYILTDTMLNSSRIRQSDCVIRYWFDHVITIRNTAPFEFVIHSLYGDQHLLANDSISPEHAMECPFTMSNTIQFHSYVYLKTTLLLV